jgi:hypothetical protein
MVGMGRAWLPGDVEHEQRARCLVATQTKSEPLG